MQSMGNKTNDGDQEQPTNEPWSEIQICGTCIDRGVNDDDGSGGGHCRVGFSFRCGGCDFDNIACFVVPCLIHKQVD